MTPTVRYHFDVKEVNQGDAIDLKHTGRATNVKWYGPSLDSIKSKSVDLIDAYGRKTSWRTTQYTDTILVRSETSFISVVGNHENGEYFLRIMNMTTRHEGLYHCDIRTNNGTVITFHKRILVRIKDTDKLKIYYNPSKRVKEGGNITICCSSKRLLPHENLRWLNTGKGKVIQSKMDQTCLVLIDVLHTDDVTFICLANGGTAKRQAMINVIYPPVVNIWHITDPNNNRYAHVRCKADGNPDNYTYKMWEHLSLSNEHIRYIDSPGFMRFGLDVDSTNWNRDDGYYVCRVSNGISDIIGKLFQEASKRVTSKGPPIFVAENMPVQYNNKTEPKLITVKVFNLSALSCTICDLATDEYDRRATVTTKISKRILWDKVYDKWIKFQGSEIIFSISNGSFNSYVVTVCDQFGNSSYEVRLKSDERIVGIASVLAITCAFILGTFIILAMLVLAVFSGSKNIQHCGKLLSIRTDSTVVECNQIGFQNSVFVVAEVSEPTSNDQGEATSSENGDSDNYYSEVHIQSNNNVLGRAYSDGSQSTDFNPSGIEVQPHYRSSGYHNVEHIQTQSGSTSCYFDLNQYTLLNKT